MEAYNFQLMLYFSTGCTARTNSLPGIGWFRGSEPISLFEKVTLLPTADARQLRLVLPTDQTVVPYAAARITTPLFEDHGMSDTVSSWSTLGPTYAPGLFDDENGAGDILPAEGRGHRLPLGDLRVRALPPGPSGLTAFSIPFQSPWKTYSFSFSDAFFAKNFSAGAIAQEGYSRVPPNPSRQTRCTRD